MRGAGGELGRDSIKIRIIYCRSIVFYYACCSGTFGYFFGYISFQVPLDMSIDMSSAQSRRLGDVKPFFFLRQKYAEYVVSGGLFADLYSALFSVSIFFFSFYLPASISIFVALSISIHNIHT